VEAKHGSWKRGGTSRVVGVTEDIGLDDRTDRNGGERRSVGRIETRLVRWHGGAGGGGDAWGGEDTISHQFLSYVSIHSRTTTLVVDSAQV